MESVPPMNGPTTAAEDALLTPILAHYPRIRPSLIPLLQDVQSQVGYVTPQAILTIAKHLDVSQHDVFGVATFFSQFRFHPPGKHCLKVCEGTACHVRGSSTLIS